MNTILDLSALRPATTLDETEAPHLEIARLQEDVADLRASALQWQELYEGALRRTKDLEERLASANATTSAAPELRLWLYIDWVGKLLRNVRSVIRRELRAKSR